MKRAVILLCAASAILWPIWTKAQPPILPGEWVPAPWSRAAIGAESTPGKVFVKQGIITVEGGGTGIWDSTDGFQFVSQAMSGDGALVTRVLSMENTDE